jgi:predicted  nucleic acid-binding Zn-ribbon protein
MSTILQLMREIEEKDERLATVESELESFKLCYNIVSTENERLKKRVETLQRNFSTAAKDGQIAMEALQRMGNIVLTAVNTVRPTQEEPIPFSPTRRVMP